MERDDIIEYSLHAHHSEEEGRNIRKKIIRVTLLLTVITAVEVLMGVFWKSLFGVDSYDSVQWEIVKWFFIVLTVAKAAYIVMVFMHLGDERKSLKYTILIPYIIFIAYLIFICLVEGLAIYNSGY